MTQTNLSPPQEPLSLPQQRAAMPERRGFGQTSRKGAWWLAPTVTLLGLLAFVVYSTWAALQGEHYYFTEGGAHYLSPFYSPVIFDAPGAHSGHSWFGDWPSWWPGWIPATPALLILWAPGLFRFTCYYYRGAYYKSFWADPPACAVGEPRKRYWGENWFPLLLQNIHRYFLYIALLFIVILSYDAWKGMWFVGEGGEEHFGIGVGSLVLLLNVVFLGGYTFGCHSLRHLVGGKKDHLRNAPCGKKTYDCVSCLNRRHMLWAWLSLFWVGFTDIYVRLCSMGIWTDWRIL